METSVATTPFQKLRNVFVEAAQSKKEQKSDGWLRTTKVSKTERATKDRGTLFCRRRLVRRKILLHEKHKIKQGEERKKKKKTNLKIWIIVAATSKKGPYVSSISAVWLATMVLRDCTSVAMLWANKTGLTDEMLKWNQSADGVSRQASFFIHSQRHYITGGVLCKPPLAAIDINRVECCFFFFSVLDHSLHTTCGAQLRWSFSCWQRLTEGGVDRVERAQRVERVKKGWNSRNTAAKRQQELPVSFKNSSGQAGIFSGQIAGNDRLLETMVRAADWTPCRPLDDSCYRHW